METFIAKIFAENKDTLVLEVCTSKQVDNIVKLSSDYSPYVKICGAENVAISFEAKMLFIDILHKANSNYENSTSLGITQSLNNDIIVTWKGANKQKINVKHLENINIGLGQGFCDENLLNLLQQKDNSYLKTYEFEEDHTQKVSEFLKQQYHKNSISKKLKNIANEREM
ncbi:MAG: hypothetical protein IJZ29_02005 [Clostridia bacterium]|nr:hypothetical protein [Clostridia bacterium]